MTLASTRVRWCWGHALPGSSQPTTERGGCWLFLPNIGLLEWVVSAVGLPTTAVHHLRLPPCPPITAGRLSLWWAGSLSTYPCTLPFILLTHFPPINLLLIRSVLVSASWRTHIYYDSLHIIIYFLSYLYHYVCNAFLVIGLLSKTKYIQSRLQQSIC